MAGTPVPVCHTGICINLSLIPHPPWQTEWLAFQSQLDILASELIFSLIPNTKTDWMASTPVYVGHSDIWIDFQSDTTHQDRLHGWHSSPSWTSWHLPKFSVWYHTLRQTEWLAFQSKVDIVTTAHIVFLGYQQTLHLIVSSGAVYTAYIARLSGFLGATYAVHILVPICF